MSAASAERNATADGLSKSSCKTETSGVTVRCVAPAWLARTLQAMRAPARERSGRRQARRERSWRLRPGLLEQQDDVHREDDREEDRPAVQVALDQRAAAERALAGADSEGAQEPGVLA